MKPILNLDELELKEVGEGRYQSKYALVSEKIGAKKLGYNLTVVPPGKTVCPKHNHHIKEEMFLILEGTGQLRFGDEEYPLQKHDIIACPPGKRDVAHQILNTGDTELRYLALSTNEPYEICEYPDSDKIGVSVGTWGDLDLQHMGRAKDSVDYLEGE